MEPAKRDIAVAALLVLAALLLLAALHFMDYRGTRFIYEGF